MNAGTNDEPVTAHDVRTAQFTLVKRGGYDTQEVDAFLDQVAETLDHVAEVEYRTPTRAPAEVVPAPVPQVQPRVDVVAAAPSGPLQLHDPDGAAQRLLAAAQRTSDAMTAEANSYAVQVRTDADTYALATRTAADDHAARVTSTAETQAATIRSAAADEARRAAEETRSTLVHDIERLEADRERLSTDSDRLRRSFDADRDRMLGIVDSLRREIAGSGIDDPGGGGGGIEVDPNPVEPLAAEVVLDPEPVAVVVLDEPVSADPVAVEPPVETAAPIEAEVEVAPEPVEPAIDPEPVVVVGESSETIRTPSIFDIEADGDWTDPDGPPTEAMPIVDTRGAGEQFFDELRRAEGDDGLGPLDEQTDAAMTAFFEGDDDEDESWRRRFGGRG